MVIILSILGGSWILWKIIEVWQVEQNTGIELNQTHRQRLIKLHKTINEIKLGLHASSKIKR